MTALGVMAVTALLCVVGIWAARFMAHGPVDRSRSLRSTDRRRRRVQ